PYASHSGWAARPRAAISATATAPRSGTVATISPVAGFSTGMPPLVAEARLGAWRISSSTCCSTLAILHSPLLACAPGGVFTRDIRDYSGPAWPWLTGQLPKFTHVSVRFRSDSLE